MTSSEQLRERPEKLRVSYADVLPGSVTPETVPSQTLWVKRSGNQPLRCRVPAWSHSSCACPEFRQTGHWEAGQPAPPATHYRSEEHTSELQSLMRISYAGLCSKTKKN